MSSYAPDVAYENRYPVGRRVKTAKRANPSTDWTAEARASRRWDIEGVITCVHDSHGLCYEVQHTDDGSIGAYEHDELRVLPAGT